MYRSAFRAINIAAATSISRCKSESSSLPQPVKGGGVFGVITGASVRAFGRVSTPLTSVALASRLVRCAPFSHFFDAVLITEVWSNWVLQIVPCSIHGETRTAGTRTPSLLKSKLLPCPSHFLLALITTPSGETAPGGA